MLTPEIVTLEFPVFIRATASVVLSPTDSLPKFSFDVEDTSDLVEPELLPLNATVTRTVPLLFFSVRLPENVPDVVGLKPTAKYVVAPPPMENGTVRELMLKAELLIEALETVTPEVVTFLIASVWVILFPIGTAPNDTDDGVELSEAACALPAPTVRRVAATATIESDAKNRWEGPPGWVLFKKVCWETSQKRFWRAKNRVLYKFIPYKEYGPRSARIY